MRASFHSHADTVAFLLQLPTAKASIDAISQGPGPIRYTALSRASHNGLYPIMQLLDAGADPAIPLGRQSSLHEATRRDHHAIAALLRHTIIEPERVRALHKARSLLGAGAGSLACLQGRMEQGQAMPQPEFTLRQRQQLQLKLPSLQQRQRRWQLQQQQEENLRATAAFAVRVSGGEDSGLCKDLYLKLLGYMLPAWADKGPRP